MTMNLSCKDRELVQSLRAEGLTLSEISRLIGISALEVEGDQRFTPLVSSQSALFQTEWFMVH